MAMPISNTHLRVPRGFGALLEGLTREILRDQPKDIPKYAAKYFEALLKQREESGIDPTEWAAKQEDRYYNNHSFKTHDLPSKTSVSNENAQAEDYSALSEEDVSLATTKTKTSDDADLATEEEPLITTQEEESDSEPPVENVDPTISTHSEAHRSPNENTDTMVSNQHISNSEAETYDLQLLSDAANIDVSAQELSENEKDNQRLTDQEEDKPKNVDVCATEIKEKTVDEVSFTDEDYANAEQDIAHDESRTESPVSQTTEYPQPEEETKSETNEVVASSEDVVESNIETQLEKSLVEVSFEDVPEGQQSINYENEQPVDMNSKLSGQEKELEVENQEETKEDEEDDCEDIDRTESAKIITSDTLGDENIDIKGEEDKSCEEEDSEKDGDNNVAAETNLTEEDISEIQTETDLQIKQNEECDKDNESEEKTLESEAHSEILDPNTSDLPEDDGEEQQPEDTLEKYITTPQELHSEKEELMEDPKLYSEEQQGQSMCEQDSINLEDRADQETTDLQEEQELPMSQRSTPIPEGETNDEQEECSRPQEEEDIMDIPLDDPEANRAAAKIQAGFRGHMTRKKMKPEDKTEGEEVSSTGDVLNGSQGGTETGGSGPVGGDDTSVPEQ